MDRKRWIAVGALTIALALGLSFGLGLTSHSASANPTEHRRLPGIRQGYTLNWSGYAVETNLASPASGVVTDVKGTWTVPKVTGSFFGRAYSSTWVGIDGYSSSTVEQIGTEQDWAGFGGSYYAWYEMYPAGMYSIGRVYPGDTINAEVASLGNGSFRLTITDVTHHLNFTTTQTSTAAGLQSAEWVEEAPSSNSGVLPLANFGTASFTRAQATVNGHIGTISDGAWANDPITMVTSGGTVKAVPSSLASGGSAFTVAWKHR